MGHCHNGSRSRIVRFRAGSAGRRTTSGRTHPSAAERTDRGRILRQGTLRQLIQPIHRRLPQPMGQRIRRHRRSHRPHGHQPPDLHQSHPRRQGRHRTGPRPGRRIRGQPQPHRPMVEQPVKRRLRGARRTAERLQAGDQGRGRGGEGRDRGQHGQDRGPHNRQRRAGRDRRRIRQGRGLRHDPAGELRRDQGRGQRDERRAGRGHRRAQHLLRFRAGRVQRVYRAGIQFRQGIRSGREERQDARHQHRKGPRQHERPERRGRGRAEGHARPREERRGTGTGHAHRPEGPRPVHPARPADGHEQGGGRGVGRRVRVEHRQAQGPHRPIEHRKRTDR